MQEGALKKVCRRTDKTFYFHLFNDCLLYSESTVLGYKLHHEFELSNCIVEDIGARARDVKCCCGPSCTHKSHTA